MAAHDHTGLLSDEALLHNIAHGCENCFDLLYLRFHRSLFHLARKIIRDPFDAEDVAQDVFLSIYEQRERFDPALGPARTWILQFGYYKSLRRRRDLTKRHLHEQNIDDDCSGTRLIQPEFLQRSLENGEIVNQALSSLAPRQRHVIELTHFEGHTLREISEMEGQELTGIRNSYYRGLHTLRTILGNSKRQVRKMVQKKRREEYEIEL